MAPRFLSVVPGALAVAVSVSAAQTADPGSRAAASSRTDYALTNVRIVAAPGRVIERGTIVTRDGRIAAAGANVQVPAGVVTMDLAGHTVYAGLIDAATSIGLPSPTREVAQAAQAGAPAGTGGRGGGRGGPPAGGGFGGPPAPVVLPEIDAGAEAADMWSPTDAQLQAMRAGGVTTVGLVYSGGLFPGRVGAALTGAREYRNALRAGVAQQVAFGSRRDGYPGTLIGALAYVKQGFLDAQYEARVEKAFKAGTPGARPSNDAFRRALMPASMNEMPSWFVASAEREISRVGEITKDVGIRAPVIVGAREGWRSIPALKAAGATAIVSLEFQHPDFVTGRNFLAVGMGKSGTAPPADTAAFMEVRGNAAALIKAGIPVALASWGGESGNTFRDRIRLAIAAGLSADDALKAATVTPAALLGVTAAVGTLDVGKLANFVVVSGNDLFAAGNPIKHVFVEGRIY